MAVEKDWKAKYFDSLKQLEDKEAGWNDLEDLLRKVISRLAITAKGLDKNLDNVLLQINKHSRERAYLNLEQDLQALSDLLATLDLKRDQPGALEARPDVALNLHVYLLKLITSLKFPPKESHPLDQVNALIKQLDKLNAEQTIREVIDIVNPWLERESTDEDSIRDVLIKLVEKISFTHGRSEHLEQLKLRLYDQFEVEQLNTYMDELIEQIRNIIFGINHEKGQLESLIVDVTRQLSEISNVLTVDLHESQASHQVSLKLQKIMDQSVSNIQTEVSQQTDINQLKTTINKNLLLIKHGVEQFRLHDEQGYQNAEKRNTQLQQQLKQMEQESDHLQHKLNENRQQLMYDSLTGVRNRLSYDEILQQEILRFNRYQETFCFSVLDVDFFKKLNDQFGHNAGDKALQIVAGMLAKYIRETDYLFRIGGEEFVLILPQTSLANATPVVEKIRASIATASFHFKKQKVAITLSAGLTAMQQGDDAESIYERADQALYQAKNSGRDRLITLA